MNKERRAVFSNQIIICSITEPLKGHGGGKDLRWEKNLRSLTKPPYISPLLRETNIHSPKGLLGTPVECNYLINQSHGSCFNAFRGVVLVKTIS